MSDRPWLQETSAALRSEREVLKQLGALSPPPGSVDRGWTALSAALPAAAPPVAAAATGVSTLAKVAAGIVLAGGALWAGVELSSPSHPPVTPAPIAAQAPPVTEPAEAAPAPSVSQPSETTDEPKRSARPGAPGSTLAEEGRLLASAHRLVQQGKGAEALGLLRTLAARYPRSVLSQEREVLTIEALGATGDTKQAKARAERFLQRHPSSPHAGRLERFAK